jgi:hypothetical protein
MVDTSAAPTAAHALLARIILEIAGFTGPYAHAAGPAEGDDHNAAALLPSMRS